MPHMSHFSSMFNLWETGQKRDSKCFVLMCNFLFSLLWNHSVVCVACKNTVNLLDPRDVCSLLYLCSVRASLISRNSNHDQCSLGGLQMPWMHADATWDLLFYLHSSNVDARWLWSWTNNLIKFFPKGTESVVALQLELLQPLNSTFFLLAWQIFTMWTVCIRLTL